MTTSTDIVNEAAALMGDDGPAVTGVAPNFDGSTLGQAAARLYAPCVAAVARQFQWPFARTNVSLAVTGNTAPFPWAFEYAYPANCVEIWQLAPASLADANDPVYSGSSGANVNAGTSNTLGGGSQ